MNIFSSFRRSPYQTLAAAMVLFFTLFLIAVILTSVSFLYGLLGYIETRPQVTVYFQSNTTEQDIFALRDALLKSGQVASVTYISKEDAFEIYKEIAKDNPMLIEMTNANILPASLEIYAKRPDYLPQIAQQLENKPGVDEVQFQKIIVDRLLALTNAIKNATIILVGFLVVMATVVIVATTSFKIALRRDEIEILQLLGADSMFIIGPYLKEGFILGLFSAILATGALIAVIIGGLPVIGGYLSGISALDILPATGISLRVWPVNPVFLGVVFMITALFGILIGTIANFLAARRYLS
ncbi:MAG: ABC transporter permease [Patescibacteria group bacterium]|nr:ABC transporter permease [Patescibacteria group bacterium]